MQAGTQKVAGVDVSGLGSLAVDGQTLIPAHRSTDTGDPASLIHTYTSLSARMQFSVL
jgi:hypothetical protein